MSDRDTSAALYARAQAVTPGGVHSPVRSFAGVAGQPVFIERADGAWLTDADGNRYLDFCMSWGPLIYGHNDPDVAAAAKQAIDAGSSFGAAEETSLQLAELIVAQIPWVEKIRFVNSGTEAVMTALRIARAATGRNKVLKFAGCYHGHVDSMLVKAGSGLADMATPDSAGVATTTAADTLVAPLDDLSALRAIVEQHAADLAAIIIEPVPANYGLLPQRDGYLRAVADIAREVGALLIFDEVITGFRLAFGGAAELFGVEPDLVTYGKIIGGGFPVGAVGGRADLMELLAPVGPVYQAGTLSANPVAMRAGLCALEKLQADRPWAALAQSAQQLAGDISSIAAANSAEYLRLQTSGSLFWMACGEVATVDGIVRAPEQIPGSLKNWYMQIFHALLEQGVYLAPSAFEVGFLSVAHTSEDLDLFIHAFSKALASS